MSAVEQCSVFDFVGDVRLTDGLREITQLSDPREPLQEAPLTGAGDGGESAPCGWRREGTGGGGGGGGVSERMLCSACHCPFENREEQMEHYKLDWHRFNLRQRLRGRPPVSTDEFEKETGAGDLSSISGSDSDDDDDDSENGGSCRGEEVMPEGAESGRVSSRVVLQNSEGRYVSLHRCVLQSRTDSVDPVQSLMKLSERTVWVVLMTGGGHFAGSVFQGKEVLHHKTFHRYTVRAKRGTAQGLRDAQNRGHAPKSAGAALRRHNEAALVKDIQDLLESWADLLKEASVIFLRIPRFNRGVFFGRGAALDKNDTRIRTIPFATRRATFRETQRVHSVLSTLNIYNKDTDVSTVFGSCKRLWQKKPPKPTAPTQSNTHDKEISDEDDDDDEDGGCVELQVTEVMVETVDLKEFEVKPSRKKRRKRKERKRDKGVVTQGEGEDVDTAVDPLGIVTKPRRKPQNKTHQPLEEPEEGDGGGGGVCPGELWEYTLRDALYTACKIGDNSTLIRLLQIPESPAEPGGPENPHTLLNTPLESGGFTLLHLASVSAQTHTVRLLLETGSDPACRDSKGQTPYAVAPDKDTRNAFRKFMAEHPDKYNYAKAQVPGPLNAEIQSKKAEKKKAQKAARKQREREHKEEKRRGEEEEEEKRRFLSLSDREKRALAAERRLAQQAATTGLPLTNSRRCFQCAESLLGKIPFEYLDFSFCSPRCVQTHRRNTTKP